MVEAFAYWVREFGIDGFRADAAWGVRERAPEFWPRLRDELKRIDPGPAAPGRGLGARPVLRRRRLRCRL